MTGTTKTQRHKGGRSNRGTDIEIRLLMSLSVPESSSIAPVPFVVPLLSDCSTCPGNLTSRSQWGYGWLRPILPLQPGEIHTAFRSYVVFRELGHDEVVLRGRKGFLGDAAQDGVFLIKMTPEKDAELT